MPKIKHIVLHDMSRIAFVGIFLVLILIMSAMLFYDQWEAKREAEARFLQIDQILREGQAELRELEIEYRQTCLNNAEVISYIVEKDPTVLDRLGELQQLANDLEVDEIHFFDATGRIFAGTKPEYYDFTFDSGEQMAFFKPLLEDRSLHLVQEITPNTAENKLMQYSAMWSDSLDIIVQVGMEPVNVMKVTEKCELSYIFSQLRVDGEADFYAVDSITGEIKGATGNPEGMVGQHVETVGIPWEKLHTYLEGFHADVNGVHSYCVFTMIEDTLVGRVLPLTSLYDNVPLVGICLFLGLMLIAMVLVKAIARYIDRFVVQDIRETNAALRAVTEGNLGARVPDHSTLEFSELSSHINEMIKSLLASTDKIAYVLEQTHARVGVYEYNESMKQVRATRCVGKVLGLSKRQAKELTADSQLFRAWLENLRNQTVPGEEDVYRLDGNRVSFVKLEEVTRGRDVLGVVWDVTDEVLRRQEMETERDMDLLTGLYNRRGLERRLAALFADPAQLGLGAMLVVDADGLKEINDTYGHEKGDLYLKKVAEVISSFYWSSKLVSRQGGDEFVIFLYHYPSEDELMDDIEALKYMQNHATAQLKADLTVPVRFSFGYALLDGRTDYHLLMQEADQNMYTNKRSRKHFGE